MKTGRLELLIRGKDGWDRAVTDKEGYPVKCETVGRMEEFMQMYKDELKEGEKFVIKENW